MTTPTSGGTETKAGRLRVLSAKEQQKVNEFRLVQQLAIQRRCGAIPVPEKQQWPDAYLVEKIDEEKERKLPVEVVGAYWRAPAEDPHKGSPWKRAHAEAARKACEQTEATGVPHFYGAHYDEPFVGPADGTWLIPPSGTQPVRPDRWILAAIEQKAAKRYSVQSILLIDLAHFETPMFESWNLGEEIAKLAEGRFLEVWIADQYSHVPKRLYPRVT